MPKCSTCREHEAKPGQRLCPTCHAIYMKQWRATNKLMQQTEKSSLEAAIRKAILDLTQDVPRQQIAAELLQSLR